MTEEAIRKCDDIIQYHSRSFTLASRLLPERVRKRAVVVYAWCRRADDAVDVAGADDGEAALIRLRRELDDIYAGRVLQDPVLSVFQGVVKECHIPRAYPDDLLAGMAMDVKCTRYEDMSTFLRYCYCVAGTVGLMMCHVMGLSDERATRNAVHLGMAMQITNICRDVLEDWERGRLYIPEEILADHGCLKLSSRLGDAFPLDARVPVARATNDLLGEAERYYSSGDQGLSALSLRCALSIRTARKVYAAIGTRVRRAGCDPLAGRAIVPMRQKLRLVSAAVCRSLVELPGRSLRSLRSSSRVAVPKRCISFPEDVIPMEWS